MTLLIFKIVLLLLLLATAIAVLFIKSPITSVVIFMSYSSIMAIVWILLEAPDLAITEAAVGAGITSVLFFITLRKINMIDTSLNSVDSETKKSESEEEKNHDEK